MRCNNFRLEGCEKIFFSICFSDLANFFSHPLLEMRLRGIAVFTKYQVKAYVDGIERIIQSTIHSGNSIAN